MATATIQEAAITNQNAINAKNTKRMFYHPEKDKMRAVSPRKDQPKTKLTEQERQRILKNRSETKEPVEKVIDKDAKIKDLIKSQLGVSIPPITLELPKKEEIKLSNLRPSLKTMNNSDSILIPSYDPPICSRTKIVRPISDFTQPKTAYKEIYSSYMAEQGMANMNSPSKRSRQNSDCFNAHTDTNLQINGEGKDAFDSGRKKGGKMTQDSSKKLLDAQQKVEKEQLAGQKGKGIIKGEAVFLKKANELTISVSGSNQKNSSISRLEFLPLGSQIIQECDSENLEGQTPKTSNRVIMKPGYSDQKINIFKKDDVTPRNQRDSKFYGFSEHEKKNQWNLDPTSIVQKQKKKGQGLLMPEYKNNSTNQSDADNGRVEDDFDKIMKRVMLNEGEEPTVIKKNSKRKSIGDFASGKRDDTLSRQESVVSLNPQNFSQNKVEDPMGLGSSVMTHGRTDKSILNEIGKFFF